MFVANLRFIAIIVLLSFLIVGGVYGYKQYKLKKAAQTGATTQNNGNGTAQSDSSGANNGGTPSLPASPSAQQLRAYVTSVQQSARDTGTLVIDKNCSGNPANFKVKKGQSFSIKNDDTVEHTLPVAAGSIFTIPAGKKITASGISDAAIYSYQCTTNGKVANAKAGTIYVEK